MNNKKIVIVEGDNWQGLYIDGELKEQYHSLELYTIFKYLDIPVDFINADDEWLRKLGYLPKKIEDIKIEE